jgi:hypothetical protein
MMIPQEQLKQPKATEAYAVPLAAIKSLGFSRRKRTQSKQADWRETVTRHVPEAWPAARLALQARIAALDIEG